MSKILVYTSSFPSRADRSSGIFIQELSEVIAEKHSVTILVQRPKDEPEREKVRKLDIIRFGVGWGGTGMACAASGIIPLLKQKKWLILFLPYFMVVSLLALIRTARPLKPDWIHAHWLIPQGFFAILCKKYFCRNTKVLITCHGSDVNKMNGVLMRFIKKWTLKRADAVTAVSDELREKLWTFCPGKEIIVAPMGIRTDVFSVDHRTPDVRAVFHMGEVSYILAVGSLIKEKGCQDLLEALLIVRKQCGDIHLVYAGDGTLREELEARAAALNLQDKVHFAGIVDRTNIPAYFAQASVFCLPSYSEGFGMVVQEAICAGLPTVISELKPLLELEHSERLFTVCKAGDPASIADALVRTLQKRYTPEERKFLMDYGSAHFSVRKRAEPYLRILDT